MAERISASSQLMPNQRLPTPDRTILEQIDLSGCISWSPEDHKEAADLLSEFADVFSRHDLDLGETLVVEHEIKLDQTHAAIP